jgi:hypothetical protein
MASTVTAGEVETNKNQPTSLNLNQEFTQAEENLALANQNTFSAQKVKDSELFQMSTSTLKDPRLADNRFFINLIGRLEAFYILAEKYR